MQATASLPRISKKAFIIIAAAAIAACAIPCLTGCGGEGSKDKNINLTTYSSESLGFSVQYNGDFPLQPDNDGFPVEQISSKSKEGAKGTIKMMYITTGIDAESWVEQQCQVAKSGGYGTLLKEGDVNTIKPEKMKFDNHDAYSASFITGTLEDKEYGFIIADNVEGGIFAYEVTANPDGFDVTSIELERVMTYMNTDPHAYDNKE